ncbi:MAG: hypothetical protein AW07_02122 [Candidatus Accumulibacter sp. SK-11]|nr:MAG: hypothetical protein AW07_02122 [Candidatus Accumulibacter sp. SK-11]
MRRRAGEDEPQRVVATVGTFADIRQLGRGVEDIGVVAEAAGEGVDSGLAVEDVAAAVAGQAVGQDVAGGVDARLAGQHELFEVVAEGEAHRRVDAIVAPAGTAFADHVGDVVDDVAVVAGAAAHDVGAGAAIEMVVAGIAGQAVGAAQSVEFVVARGSGELVAAGVAGHRPAGEGGSLQRVAAATAACVAGEQVVGARRGHGMDDLRAAGSGGGVVVAGDCRRQAGRRGRAMQRQVGVDRRSRGLEIEDVGRSGAEADGKEVAVGGTFEPAGQRAAADGHCAGSGRRGAVVVAVRRVVVEDDAGCARCPEAEAGRRVRQGHDEGFVGLDDAVSLDGDRDGSFGLTDRESDAARGRTDEIGRHIGRRRTRALQAPVERLLRRAGGVQAQPVGEHRRAAVSFELLGDVAADRHQRAHRRAAEEFADRFAAVGKNEDLHLADGIGAADGAVEVEADVLRIGIGVAAVGAGEDDAVAAVAAVQQIVAEAGDQDIVTDAAEQAVVAGAAIEPVGQRIAGDLVCRRTADCVLD